MKTFQEFITEAKKCWPGYKKKGTQKLFGKTYNRCVKEDYCDYCHHDPCICVEEDIPPYGLNEEKKCPDGKYWCFTDKKCKKIPLGWYVGRGGYLEKDDEDKKNENGDSDSNGSGDGGGVSEGNDFLHQGNPNPQMRNMPMGTRNAEKLANAYGPHIKNQLIHGLHSLHKARESAKNTKIMKSPSVRVAEGWSEKYKESIDCDNPKGFSQRAHCQGRKKKKLDK